jgi:beta-lactamase superfamily II metal-dependent hydrolase
MGKKIRYISKDTAMLYIGPKFKIELLWGDKIKVDEDAIKEGRVKCWARGLTGYISKDAYGEESLLEIYIIDVGQGDGILIKCPDEEKASLGRHILIDGGYKRDKQPTMKSAADFVDWKFSKEYGSDSILIDDMIVSHCDADHYGGLWDLVSSSEEAKKEIECKDVIVKNLYHAGLAWWTMKKGAARSLGLEKDGRLKNILTDKQSIQDHLDKGKYPHLQGEYHDFFEDFVKNQPAAKINFIGYESGSDANVYLPGYAPEDGEVAIEVLGPLYHKVNGKIECNDLGGKSINTNGNSVLLALNYKSFKILLTGDLNSKSQGKLLDEHSPSKFATDVAKACHHGSHDVSFKFLQKVNAAATIISSGDNESHSHPRANLLSMSAISGFMEYGNDTIISPLIFSTEIARSIKIGKPQSGKINHPPDNGPGTSIEIPDINQINLTYEIRNSGDLNPKTKSKNLSRLNLIDGIIYGLVNIRTDGNRILFAVRKEKGHEWETSVLYSRFSPT